MSKSPKISIIVSVLALLISVINAWFTWFHKGQVKMSKPTSIYFGFTAPIGPKKEPRQVIAFPSTLISTNSRGHLVESMYVKIQGPKENVDLNVWRHGQDALKWGGGIFVPYEGVVTNHFFFIRDGAQPYLFSSGLYKISVYAIISPSGEKMLLDKFEINITEQLEKLFTKYKGAKRFDWWPEEKKYIAHDDSCKRIFPRLIFPGESEK